MPKCPVCEGGQVIVVLNGSREARCLKCEARWVQDGALQRHVEAGPDRPQRTGAR